MTVGVTRLRGVLLTAIMLAAVYYVWQSARPATTPDTPPPPARGGQLTASIRAEPRSFNKIVARDQTTYLLDMLMQGRLVRVNRASFDLEPWLAERWDTTPDGLTHTLHLRRVVWSDGTPFTSADVLFSFDAAFSETSGSVVASSLTIAGQPIRASAVDDRTVTITFPGPSGPGLRLLDNLPILPKHKLESALAAGTFASAWSSSTVPGEIVGTGPFVLREYRAGERLILERNPRYWRTAADGATLPYLDRLVLEIVPDQNAELLRLQSGATDLPPDALRTEDFVAVRRSETEGKLRLIELGVATDADSLWFCLKPEVKNKDPRFAFVQRPELRQAISHAVDREAFANAVFLGEAVPIWGPVTPGNRQWFSPNVPRYPPDLRRARELLASIGLEDRNGNGVVEDTAGTEARFTVITQRGVGWYERGLTVLREQAGKIGITLDIVPLEFGAMIQRMLACDYDAIYMRVLATDLDPAVNLDFWLSSGSAHVWNLEQKTPATGWEQRIDTIMREQAAAQDPERRRELFNEAQRILAENLPIVYFAAPRLFMAHSTRVVGVVPSVMRPPVLWNADAISVR